MESKSQDKKPDHPQEDSTREKNIEPREQPNMPGSGVLTNTPGSPKVPTPEEMAASPGADGQDNRIDLDQKPKKNSAGSREENEND